MHDSEIQMLVDASDRLVSGASMDFRRYLCPRIDWGEKLLCIKGPKGTGKTRLILQHVKETFGVGSGKAVYFALDHIWFSNYQPIDAIEHFHSHGYTHLFIDATRFRSGSSDFSTEYTVLSCFLSLRQPGEHAPVRFVRAIRAWLGR